jgi:hypothetical protein
VLLKNQQFKATTNLNGYDVSARVQVTTECDWGLARTQIFASDGRGVAQGLYSEARRPLDRGWVALSAAHHGGMKVPRSHWSWNPILAQEVALGWVSRAGGLVILRLESAEAWSMS